MTITNKITGEILDVEVDTPKGVLNTWLLAKELERLAKQVKAQLRDTAQALADTKEEIDGYMFKAYPVQRYKYEKSKLRDILDEDTLDLFLKVDKTALDEYIKENAELKGINRKDLLIEDGLPYSVVKLEKLSSV